MKQIVFLVLVVAGGVLLASLVLRSGNSSPTVKSSDSKVIDKDEKENFLGKTEKTKKNYPKYNEIAKPSGFVNTDEISIGELIGEKVVLVDFMTYTCINCIRTFPYLVAWYDRYKDQGLEIVGIHTPEFAFEKKRDNVIEAMKKHGITFPIVLDNDYGTWRAYENNFWPRKYLIDIDGNIVYDHIGEGAYDKTEAKIQELLEERAERLGLKDEIDEEKATVVQAEGVDFTKRRSPETYFGTLRNKVLGNGEIKAGGVMTYVLPKAGANLKPSTIYLDGDWKFTGEYAENQSAGAKIVYRYVADKVFLVMSAADPSSVILRQDGKLIGSAGGTDVKNNVFVVGPDEMYRLVDNPEGNSEHVLEIEIADPGVRVFAFTFG